jgi:hypothetical protein
MAGGKETPRQKLIGLMYLVLTALLALNVSKQILDAFVAIEENIHRGSEASQERGQQTIELFTGDLKAAQSTNDQATIKRINQCLKWISEIDKDVDLFIQETDQLKEDMIVAVEGKEKLKAPNEEKGGPILLKESTYKGADYLKPHKFNLNAIDRQDDFDQPMAVLELHEIGEIKENSRGMKLWKNYLKVRESLVTKAGTYTDFKGKKWKLNISKHINNFTDNKTLAKDIERLFKSGGNKVNPMDNATLIEVYQALTKKEKAKYHEEKQEIHWVGRTFDHSPLVGAIASISSLQNEVLAARLKIVNLIKQRQGGGEFTFNSIRELVSGPGVATSGEDIELYVTMAAYNSDRNPDVSSNTGSISIKDGIGIVKLKAGASDMTINGKVSIKNSMGTSFEKPWQWKVAVVKPQGSISLPEMMVLYRGYDNKVVPMVVGSISSSISASNCIVCKKSTFNVDGQRYDGYIVRPGSQSQVVMTLSGKDKDGKSKTYGSFKYKVRAFPNAQVVGGKTFSKSKMYNASVGLADASFTGVSYTVIGGRIIAGQDEFNFTGSKVSPSLIEKVKVGKRVTIEVSYKRVGTNDVEVATEILKVSP